MYTAFFTLSRSMLSLALPARTSYRHYLSFLYISRLMEKRPSRSSLSLSLLHEPRMRLLYPSCFSRAWHICSAPI